MVLAEFRKRFYRAEGREEGREEGRQEGRAEQDRLWREWNQRRLQAELDGVVFDEPTPDATATE